RVAPAHRRDHPRRVPSRHGRLDDLRQPLPVCHLLSLRSSRDSRRILLIGPQALVASLTGAGVDVCFMNPGTSEMHFVSALDSVPQMRGVLALFEGGATGAADGYARMAGKPASVLLHLGPGLGNGLANLHNARKGHVP